MNWNGKPPYLWIATHILAISAGWAFASFGGGEKPAAITASPAPAAKAGKTKVSRQREMPDRSQPAAMHVWSLLEELDEARNPESVAPASDRAAAAREAIDAWVMDRKDPQLLLDARIRFAHWLETDTKAALMYWNGSGAPGTPALASLADVARPYLETAGIS